MIDTVAKKTTEKLINNDIISFDDYDIYLYGLQLVYSTIVDFIGIILITFALGWIKEAIIFLLIFSTLRVQAGGYHAKTYLSCFIMTSLFVLVPIWGVKNLEVLKSLSFQGLIIFIAMIIFFIFAPKDTPNKPLSEREVKKYRRNSRILVTVYSLTIIVTCIYSKNLIEFCAIASLAVFIESLTLIIND
ncbi:accessory gene regulator ArgB-like protein [Dethiothermospora halolimnae]|uniref:accessory gene regulator ArgB-like protein n=1 Tax=Dethiothermospora halolimnae TaxID=3114390 RepID=UPI003CCBC1FF